MGNMIVKYVAAGLVLASLFTLVILGQMTSGEYQVIAIATLSALGGYHAGSANRLPHIPDTGKMVGAPLFLPQLQNHIEDKLGMVNPQVKPADPTQPVTKE